MTAQPLNNTSIEVMILPVDSTGNTITQFNKAEIEVLEDALPGADQLKIQSSLDDVFLVSGTALSFAKPDFSETSESRKQVIVLNDCNLSGSPEYVQVSGLLQSIKKNEVAYFIENILPLNGVQSLDLSSQETQIDTTNITSEKGVYNVFVRHSMSCTVTGIALAGDKALETVIKPVGMFSSTLFGRDIYAVITLPDGERYAGVAKIGSMSLPASQNEVKRFSFTLIYQGEILEWNPPYSFDDYS